MSDSAIRRPSCLVDPRQFMAAEDEIAAYDRWFLRFGGLLTAARLVTASPLFVSRAGETSELTIEQFDGGRDAQYFVVTRKRGGSYTARRETIGFVPQVAGTEIIYDLSDEKLQGKARPFDCDLKGIYARVYALMPVQIEAIALAPVGRGTNRSVTIEFLDAGGRRLEAVLPFHCRFEAVGQLVKAEYYITGKSGRFLIRPEQLANLPRDCQLTVRSQLTGRETTLNV